MDREIIDMKDRLIKEADKKAFETLVLISKLVPTADEISTDDAYAIFGGTVKAKKMFDHHRLAGNISPIRGKGRKSRLYWSMKEVISLREATKIKMEVV